jgi:hypothetical protein
VLGVFLQTYLPEQLMLDDELERLRITLISNLAHEKSSLRALVEQCLKPDYEGSVLPKDILAFLN